MSRRIYLDQDGVLADYYGAMRDHGYDVENQHYFLKPQSEWTDEQKKQDELIREIMARPYFWRLLPTIHGARILWSYCNQKCRTSILTAAPKLMPEHHARIANDKFVWACDEFGHINPEDFICVPSMDKKSAYARSYNDILVDDIEKNVLDWRKAGGLAVHFKNTYQAMRELSEILR